MGIGLGSLLPWYALVSVVWCQKPLSLKKKVRYQFIRHDQWPAINNEAIYRLYRMTCRRRIQKSSPLRRIRKNPQGTVRAGGGFSGSPKHHPPSGRRIRTSTKFLHSCVRLREVNKLMETMKIRIFRTFVSNSKALECLKSQKIH